MKRICYANSDFLTDDAVADVLMEYARVLAVVGSADVVEVPGVDREGTTREYRLVIGPASQLLSATTDDMAVPLDLAAVDDLRDRARRRLPTSFEVADTSGPAESDAESTAH
jgi:hypothetical protein